jgi:hypothetical protein
MSDIDRRMRRRRWGTILLALLAAALIAAAAAYEILVANHGAADAGQLLRPPASWMMAAP